MTKWIELTGPQYEQLETTMVRLFNTNSLQRLLLYRLDVTLGNVVAVGAWQQVVFDLINVAQQEGWLDDLLVAASEARPNHPALEALRAEIGLGKSVSGEDSGALEAFVQGVGGLLDPEVFRTKLAMAEAASLRNAMPTRQSPPVRRPRLCRPGPGALPTHHPAMSPLLPTQHRPQRGETVEHPIRWARTHPPRKPHRADRPRTGGPHPSVSKLAQRHRTPGRPRRRSQ
jgi:Effector-associated domain 1